VPFNLLSKTLAIIVATCIGSAFCRAQTAPARADLKELFIEALVGTKLSFPQMYSAPGYEHLPAHNRTPVQCIGYESIGRFFQTSVAPRTVTSIRGAKTPYGSLSFGELRAADSNVVDVVPLTDSHRQKLRALLQTEIQRIKRGQAVRSWGFTLVSFPGALKSKPAEFAVYTISTAFSQGVDNFDLDEVTQLTILWDRLLSPTDLYSVSLFGLYEGKEHVRYAYALKPADRNFTILHVCTLLRR